jgi:hypothetical protein
MPIAMLPPRQARDPRMEELDRLIAAMPPETIRRPGPRNGKRRPGWAARKRARLDAIAAEMRKKYRRIPAGGKCSVETCGRTARAGGMCGIHYQRQYRRRRRQEAKRDL